MTRNTHTCHWPDCPRVVPPALFMCKPHWFKLPKPLRDRIWKEYRPGQEIDKRPSQAYLAIVALALGWIAGKVTFNPDGSLVVHEDLPVPRVPTAP